VLKLLKRVKENRINSKKERDVKMVFTGHLMVYTLAGLIAGLILLASHNVFKAIDFRPHVLVNYMYGSLVWTGCATIATAYQVGTGADDTGTIIAGFWVVLAIAGAFDLLAYALSHLGARNRVKRIKREIVIGEGGSTDKKNEYNLPI
jgi:hypothetical protein